MYVTDIIPAIAKLHIFFEECPNIQKKSPKTQNNVFYGRLWFIILTNHSIVVSLLA